MAARSTSHNRLRAVTTMTFSRLHAHNAGDAVGLW
jgi:hypothetical protein